VFRNGKYKIDKELGIIHFGAGMDADTILLEYISDGVTDLPEAKIKVHKFAYEAIDNYIYWKLIERRRNVPFNESIRAEKEYKKSKLKARRRLNTLREDEIMQIIKGQYRWN